MVSTHSPRMSNEDYFRCLDRAAATANADTVRRIRTEILERWRGDPRADELAVALEAHEQHLAERLAAQGRSGSRVAPRVEPTRIERTHLSSPIANRQSLRSGH